MEVAALAASAVAATAQQTRDGFSIAAIKVANEQTQMIADMISNVADTARAMNPVGVGGNVDRVA